MEKENNIGEQIKQYRAKHHLTLTQFGQYFDPVAVTNTIRNWENSKRKPNQKHQEQLKVTQSSTLTRSLLTAVQHQCYLLTSTRDAVTTDD